MAAKKRDAVVQAASLEWPFRPSSTQSSALRGRQVCHQKAAIVLEKIIRQFRVGAEGELFKFGAEYPPLPGLHRREIPYQRLGQ